MKLLQYAIDNKPALMAIMRRHTSREKADDAYQKMAIRLFKKEDVDTILDIGSYLSLMAKHMAMNANRDFIVNLDKYDPVDPWEDKNIKNMPSEIAPVDNSDLVQEVVVAITKKLGRREKQKKVFFDVVLGGRSYQEIALHTGENYNTIKANYLHAVRCIRKSYKEIEGMEVFNETV